MAPEFLGKASKQLPTPRIICGVYFLMLGDACVYVGQSVNICSRVVTHVTKFAFDSVHYIEVIPSRLDKVERYWIKRLQPIHNQVGNNANQEKKRNNRLSRKLRFLEACNACGELSTADLSIEWVRLLWLFDRGIVTLRQLEESVWGPMYTTEIEVCRKQAAMRERKARSSLSL